MKKLCDIEPGDLFTWNGRKYQVVGHSNGMTEVWDKSRHRPWAWPSFSVVVGSVGIN